MGLRQQFQESCWSSWDQAWEKLAPMDKKQSTKKIMANVQARQFPCIWLGFLPLPLLGGFAYLDPFFSQKMDPSLMNTFINIPLGLMGGVGKFQKEEANSIH